MADLISVSEAASLVRLDPSRVRALAASGQIPAVRVGRNWAIDRTDALELARSTRQPGRPFGPGNAWALLFLASGQDPEWIDSNVASRLRRSFRLEGLRVLAPRLGRRGKMRRFRAHAGEVPHLLSDAEFRASGISAAGAHRLDLVSANEVDGYLRASQLNRFARNHALDEARPGDSSNVALRVVPDDAWYIDQGVPAAAVALDLIEERDPRALKAGEVLLRRLAAGEQAIGRR